jgi:2-dehydropantoate 2-reductase
MRILSVGVGAIGGTVAAHLVRAGLDVELVDADRDHVEAMKRKGLTTEAPGGEFTVPVRALQWEEVRGPLETVLLAVKSQATGAAVRQLLPYLGADSVIVSVQNGLNEDLIARLAGRDRTLGAFINFSADYLEPGRVAYSGPGPFYLGELDGSRSDRLRRLEEALSNFTPITVTDNIYGYLWTKLGYGTMVTASGIVDMDQADAFERHRELMVELGSETYEVAMAEGVDLPSVNGIAPRLYVPRGARDWAAIDRSLDELIDYMRRHQKPRSGVWRDLAIRKRNTEVDHNAGPAVEIGARHGLQLPLTRALVRMVHEIEDGRRGLAPANLEELDALREQAAPT